MALMERNSNILDRPADRPETGSTRSLSSIAEECATALDAGDLLVLSHEESMAAAREMEHLMATAKREAAKLIKAARQK